MRTLFFFIGMCFVAGAARSDSPFGDKDAKKKDQLPLTAPDGWVHEQMGGKAFLMGPVHDNFRANINVATETANVPLAMYVDTAIESAQKVFPNMKLLKKDEFKTTGGITGIRYDCSNEINKLELRQIFYIFDGGDDKKIVFTGSVLASQGDKLAPTFDSIMKTYKP